MTKHLLLLLSSMLFSMSVAFGQTAVWEITTDSTKIYLGGSIHLLRGEDYPLPAAFDSAFTASEVIVFETDMAEMQAPNTSMKLFAASTLPNGQMLKDVLSEEVYGKLSAACESLGIPMVGVQNMKPFAVTTILETTKMNYIGFSAAGVDAYYFGEAEKATKPTEALEPVDYQIEMLTSLGTGYENELVQSSLDELETLGGMMPELVSQWREGKAKMVETELERMKKDFPDMYRLAVTDRNNNWLPVIEKYLADKRTEFVIVGYAHLPGPAGLLKQLADKGYSVRQMK